MRCIPLALLLASVLALLAGCGGGRVGEAFQPDEKLTAWSDEEWKTVLDAVATDDGFVRWDKIKNNTGGVRDALFRYVGRIGAASPRNRPALFPTDDDKLAYYINAYNALAMYGVVQRGYPGNVLRPGFVDPGGLFFIDKFRVGGKNTTLNGLEREEVRERSGLDPRIHFAVNCMSYSCPPLRKEPFVGARLDEQLDEQGRIYLSDRRAVRAEDEETVKLNAIFYDYYKGDFIDAEAKRSGAKDPDLITALRPYAADDSPLKTARRWEGMGYDWSLNRPPKR